MSLNKIENQHGDLLFVNIGAIPETAKRISQLEKGYVLERGEGIHTHVLEDVDGVEVFEDKGEIYVRVSKQVRINHEEHGIQTLTPGTYKKGIEQVKDLI